MATIARICRDAWPGPPRRAEARCGGPGPLRRLRVTASVFVLAAAAAACGCSEKRPGPTPGDREPSGGPPSDPAVSAAEPHDGPSRLPEYEVIDPLPENPTLEILLEAMGGDDVELRSTAIESAGSMHGEEVTRWLVGRMRTATPAARAALLDALARREDVSGLPTALQATRDPDRSVRLAAIRTAAALGREMVVGPLVDLVAREGDEGAAARKALLVMPGPEASAAVAQSLKGAPAAVRRALIEILAGRHATAHVGVVLAAAADGDESVRLAAVKALGELAGADILPRLVELLLKMKGRRELRAAERALSSVCARIEDKESCARAVLAALARSEGEGRCSLLRVLGRLGDPSGLPAIRAAIEDPEAKVRDAAVRALVGWHDVTVAPDLLSLAGGAPERTHRVLALRGYVRLAGLPSERSAEDTLGMYRRAAALADELGSPEDKGKVLAGLAGMKHPAALRMALPYLGDEALRAEAAAAVVKIAGGLVQSQGGPHADEARAALEKVLAAPVGLVGEDVKTRAREALGAAGRQEPAR